MLSQPANDYLCFLRPFHHWTWLVIFATLAMFAVALTTVSAIYRRWQNPSNDRRTNNTSSNNTGTNNTSSNDTLSNNPTILENEYSFTDSLWLFWTSWLQIGSDSPPQPISAAGKLLTSAWSCFVLIVLAMYTANLAAFFARRPEFKPLEDIAQLEADSRHGAPNFAWKPWIFLI